MPVAASNQPHACHVRSVTTTASGVQSNARMRNLMARRIEFGQLLAAAGDAEQERLGAACGIGFPLRRMTGNTELVAIWVPEVRAIVVGVVFGPQAGLTV